MAVCGAGSEKNGVGVPGYTSHGRANGLLNVLRDPPVVFFLKVAYGDQAGAGANSELGLRGGPADTSRSAIDAEKNQSGLPALW